MDINHILNSVKDGSITVDDAKNMLTYADIGVAKIDHNRANRRGFNESVFCQGKTVTQISKIAKHYCERNTQNVLFTRISREAYEAIAEFCENLEYHEDAKIVVLNRVKANKTNGKIAVITGGTSDIGVAEEAAITAEVNGNEVLRVFDAGVAGIHRLLSNIDAINSCDVIIAVAGMEGALAGVMAGLTDKPVIAVPTSVGYGASFNGLAPLLTMLNSCAEGIGVVNIDNGFGAGCLASVITRMVAKFE